MRQIKSLYVSDKECPDSFQGPPRTASGRARRFARCYNEFSQILREVEGLCELTFW
jgi:hypothetical protein